MSFGECVRTRKPQKKRTQPRAIDLAFEEVEIPDELVEISFINDYCSTKKPDIKDELSNTNAYGTIYPTSSTLTNEGKIVGIPYNAVAHIVKNTKNRLDYAYANDTICFEEIVVFVIATLAEGGWIIRKDKLIIQIKKSNLFSEENNELRAKKVDYVRCYGHIVSYHAITDATFVKQINFTF